MRRGPGKGVVSGPLKAAIAVLAFGLLVTAWAAATNERVPMPQFAPVERGAYRARALRTGDELWRVDWVLRRATQDSRPILRLQEEGTGRREGPTPTAWSVRMTIDLWGSTPRLESIREARDDRGHPLQVEQRDFDYGRGVGRVTTTDHRTGDTASKTVALTPTSFPPEILPALLRLLPAAADHQLDFALVMRGGIVVGMHAQIVGRERVAVPAGSFDCVKVELEPTGFYGVLAHFLLPKFFMWQTAAAPHFWVKYQGPEAGPGSQEIVRELVRFDSEAEAR